MLRWRRLRISAAGIGFQLHLKKMGPFFLHILPLHLHYTSCTRCTRVICSLPFESNCSIYLYLNNTGIESFISKYFSFADCHIKLYLEGWSPFQENTFNSLMDFQTFIGDGEEKMMTYIKGNQKFHSAVQFSSVQYSTVQYSTVQYSTVQYSTVQYSTVQHSTVQYSKVQYSTVQYGTVRYGTVQYSTVQYSTVQYGTVRYGTVQYSTV